MMYCHSPDAHRVGNWKCNAFIEIGLPTNIFHCYLVKNARTSTVFEAPADYFWLPCALESKRVSNGDAEKQAR